MSNSVSYFENIYDSTTQMTQTLWLVYHVYSPYDKVLEPMKFVFL